MAMIRIVDDWLRSPMSPPSRWRAVMVIAEKWAEQRVLMRAFAESRDQLRPTIVLHGMELAIGPAGTDANGPWGVHVGENPDGKAQDIKAHFETAARRLAGSKGNPPRLTDEESTFDREPTGQWSHGGPRVLPKRPDPLQPAVDYVTTPAAARVPQLQQATYVKDMTGKFVVGASQDREVVSPSNPATRMAPVARTRRRGSPPTAQHARTAIGFASGSGTQSLLMRLGLQPSVSATLGHLVERLVPPDFQIEPDERRALNAIGGGSAMTAKTLGLLLGINDPVAFMEDLIRKLESFDIQLVEPAEPVGGEPTYRIRR